MGDPTLAPMALQLLFHFQDPGLANAEEHPNREVLLPIIAIASVIRDLLAVPVPLALRLPDVMKHLRADGFDFEYEASDLFNFELSNALKSDAIHLAWHKGRKEAVDWVKSELRRRLIATSSVLDGLREQTQKQLFAWPPKFQLATALKFQHPELSRIAFVVRYECVMAALAVRESRCLPRYERLREAISIPLRFEGGSRWKVMSEVDQSAIEIGSGMPDKLLVLDDEEGERDQMCYDDHRCRSAWWAPRTSVRLASIQDVGHDNSGLVTYLNLNITNHKEQQPFQKGAHAVLHPRFTDFNSDRIVKRLQQLDTEPEADFLALIHAPQSFARNVPASQKLKTAAPQEYRLGKLTPSQNAALEQLLSNRLTLAWGLPGTGKTHFLAQAILRIAMRLACRGEAVRVGVAAFTHAAIENLLRELQDLAIEKGLGERCGVYKLKYCSTPRGETLTAIPEENVWSIPQDGAVVVGGTVYSFYKAVSKTGFAPLDLLVIDEASQMKMGELALCMVVLKPGGRLVLAGDDLQLPPIIQGEYPPSDDGLPGLQDSVFAYLRARDRTKDPYTWLLLENWRMNATLSRFPAETLYDTRYQPVNDATAERRLLLEPPRNATSARDDLVEHILDPEWPLTVCLLDGIQATVENPAEAEIVALLTLALRERMHDPETDDRFPSTKAGDADFWRRGLFIVSPHHAQIRTIHAELARRRNWHVVPFVDTVDKMQGQQCESVIVSYGVSDRETALAEAGFIYSRNRLNVSVTRARSKCILFLSRPLLNPSFELLQDEEATEGLAHMHALLHFCRRHGEERQFAIQELNAGADVVLRVFRARYRSN